MKWESIIAGLVVAGVNGVLALAAVYWGLTQRVRVFMVAFFGGMILRLGLVIVLSVLVLKRDEVHTASYIAALVAAYLFFLLLEVLYVLKKGKKQTNSPRL